MSNRCWLQLLKCQDLLFVFVMCGDEWRVNERVLDQKMGSKDVTLNSSKLWWNFFSLTFFKQNGRKTWAALQIKKMFVGSARIYGAVFFFVTNSTFASIVFIKIRFKVFRDPCIQNALFFFFEPEQFTSLSVSTGITCELASGQHQLPFSVQRRLSQDVYTLPLTYIPDGTLSFTIM